MNIVGNRWDYWYDSYAVSLDISFQWLNWWSWNHTALKITIILYLTQEIYNEQHKLMRVKEECEEKETEKFDIKFRVAANPTVSEKFLH